MRGAASRKFAPPGQPLTTTVIGVTTVANARPTTARQLWQASFSMSGRMIRARRPTTAAAAWTWFLQHARARFTTPAGWRIAQLAGRIVFEARTPLHARAGSVAELVRQGLV